MCYSYATNESWIPEFLILVRLRSTIWNIKTIQISLRNHKIVHLSLLVDYFAAFEVPGGKIFYKTDLISSFFIS